MLRTTLALLAAVLTVSWAALAWGEPGDLPAFTDAEEAGADFAVQGEYSGELASKDGPKKYGIQVIALGDGKFQAVVHRGGLPGDGWEKGEPRSTYEGKTADGATVFPGNNGEGRIADGVLTVTNSGGEKLGQLEKVERKSLTLGAKPPEGAVVLFDGTTADAFDGGKLTDDNLLAAGCKSRDSFGSFRLHLEFRTPFMPTAQGQARGNSGVYLQDRYEFQVLDSFGLEGKDNECGGLYSIQAPRLNMCFPPLAWQTYDFDFTAPKFDEQGKKTANARVTLKHNGVLVYDDFEIPRLTPGGLSEEGPTGPIALQQHGNPVVYRNIWLVEKK